MQVYKFEFPNGDIYIGSTYNTSRRWVGKGRNYRYQLVGRAISEHGWDNIKRTVVWEGEDVRTAQNIEYSLIEMFKSRCLNVAGAIAQHHGGNHYQYLIYDLQNEHCRILYQEIKTYCNTGKYSKEVLKTVDITKGLFLSLCDDYLNPKRKSVLQNTLLKGKVDCL